MKNNIQSIVITILTLLISQGMYAQQKSINDEAPISKNRIAAGFGMAHKNSYRSIYTLDISYLKRMSHKITLESTAGYKCRAFDIFGSTSIEDAYTHFQIDIFSGVNYYLAKETAKIRSYALAQIGGSIIQNPTAVTTFYSKENTDQSLYLLPNYNLGLGVEFYKKVRFVLSKERNSVQTKIAFVF